MTARRQRARSSPSATHTLRHPQVHQRLARVAMASQQGGRRSRYRHYLRAQSKLCATPHLKHDAAFRRARSLACQHPHGRGAPPGTPSTG